MLFITTTKSPSGSKQAAQVLIVGKAGSCLMFNSTNPLLLIWLAQAVAKPPGRLARLVRRSAHRRAASGGLIGTHRLANALKGVCRKADPFFVLDARPANPAPRPRNRAVAM